LHESDCAYWQPSTPNAVIGPSTAFNGGAPSQDGFFVLTYSYNKRVELPGLSVQLAKGGKPT
jgi:hypothetical protein